nr:MAG TPA: hypothetical protein [Caudoviricetes sp.]
MIAGSAFPDKLGVTSDARIFANHAKQPAWSRVRNALTGERGKRIPMTSPRF